MTKKDKLEYVKSKLNDYIIDIQSVSELKAFLNNLNKQSLIVAIKGKIDEDISSHQQQLITKQTKIDDLIAWKGELNAL